MKVAHLSFEKFFYSSLEAYFINFNSFSLVSTSNWLCLHDIFVSNSSLVVHLTRENEDGIILILIWSEAKNNLNFKKFFTSVWYHFDNMPLLGILTSSMPLNKMTTNFLDLCPMSDCVRRMSIFCRDGRFVVIKRFYGERGFIAKRV